MSKKEKLKAFYRQNILEAAQKLFAAKGFANTTMDDIAREAELSKTTIYGCFNKKEEIYNGILLENMKRLKLMMEDAVKDKPFVEAYMNICYAHVEFQEKYPLFFESMLSISAEGEGPKSAAWQEISAINAELNQMIEAFLNKGIEEKVVKPDIDPLVTGFALWAGICGLILMAAHKTEHINCLNNSKKNFLEYGFKTYLNAILL